VQTWGINLGRVLSRRNEVARLVFTPKDEAGFVSRFAHLTGLYGRAASSSCSPTPP